MKTLVVYYSFSGHSRGIAEAYAREHGADLQELRDEKKMNIFTAFLVGCPNAMKGRPAKLQNFTYHWADYDELVFVMPVWAGCPVPAFNNCAAVLPQGKQVTLILCSGGGNSAKSKQRSCELVQRQGCTVKEYTDIKTD